MRTTPIQSIVFDIGGVLINWDPHRLFSKYFPNNSQAIDLFLNEIDFFKWNLSQDQGYPFDRAVKEHSTRFPQYEHLIRAYHEEWEESIEGIIPGTVDILFRLKAAGYRLYGLTNWSAEKFPFIRRKYKPLELFEDIVISGEEMLIKPDPAIYNLILQRIHGRSKECLMIDDSQTNIMTAQEMGFVTIQYVSPNQLESALKQMKIL